MGSASDLTTGDTVTEMGDGTITPRNTQGDVTGRINAVDAVTSEMYGNDKADQLTGLTRGTISDGTIASPSYEEDFLLDGNGNIGRDTVQQTVSGSLTTTLDQQRTPSLTNEIASVTNATGDMAAPSYDPAGNSTVTPSALDPTLGLSVQVDAWNHVTHVWDGAIGSAGSTIDISYQYDGLGYMDVRTDNLAAAGAAVKTFFYYTGPQVLESIQVKPGSPGDGAKAVTDQFVLSPRYVDSPILDTQTVSTYSTSTSSWSCATNTYYFLTDANKNVTSLVNSSGGVVERYVYSAYGSVTVYSSDYSSTYTASTVSIRVRL